MRPGVALRATGKRTRGKTAGGACTAILALRMVQRPGQSFDFARQAAIATWSSPGFRIGGMRPVFDWNIGSRSLLLGKRTLVMGVVNVTSDSFSDAGLYFARDRAVEHGLRLIEAGADIVDVGGESTRPGASVLARGELAQANSQSKPVVTE